MERLQKKMNSLLKQKPCFLYFWKKIGKLSRIPPAYLEESLSLRYNGEGSSKVYMRAKWSDPAFRIENALEVCRKMIYVNGGSGNKKTLISNKIKVFHNRGNRI
ncbi:hypothetical protein LI325_28305 [Enterocloster lavalensis]|nr:hypothetical protein [Enterocloster lavalensis]